MTEASDSARIEAEGQTSGAQAEPEVSASSAPPAKPRRQARSTASAPRTRERAVRKRVASAKASSKKGGTKSEVKVTVPTAKYPRHSVDRALRIPRVILDQNAGRPTSMAEASRFLGGKASGEFQLETSSAKKYGFLVSEGGKLVLTDRAKRALRPQNETDELTAIREAVLEAPEISDVYNYYRGEYLPDDKFFANALSDTFRIPADKVSDFKEVFTDSLGRAKLLDDSGDRPKLIDVGREDGPRPAMGRQGTTGKASRAADSSDVSCFVMQPFSAPYNGYYENLLKPAIQQAGLRPVRADDEIFGAGKIMDQVWRGIRNAQILVAELTTRNANVYYELGLAHALGKPVVLIAADGEDVPFDVQHIRVIYYDIHDPFWGQKLIDKMAENLQSALANPEEAVLNVSGLV